MNQMVIEPAVDGLSEGGALRFIDSAQVRRHLDPTTCIDVVREAMVALSSGETRQLLRSIIPLAAGRMFGIMPGALSERSLFGAKLVSVFPENFSLGKPSHQGVIALFDGQTGAPVCIADAGEITALRTAAASAVATAALARADAASLAVLGYGEQAFEHVRAILLIRPIERLTVWGRSTMRATAFVNRIAEEFGIATCVCDTVEEAVCEADVICTLTAASEPILLGHFVRMGTHVNLVGSSHAGASEVDDELVVRSLFVADSREGVSAQGGEFVRARGRGLVEDDHIAAEIGEIISGIHPGRTSPDQVTVYKSLGHIVQDLASAQAVYRAVMAAGSSGEAA